jgi:hypothetical protein
LPHLLNIQLDTLVYPSTDSNIRILAISTAGAKQSFDTGGVRGVRGTVLLTPLRVSGDDYR